MGDVLGLDEADAEEESCGCIQNTFFGISILSISSSSSANSSSSKSEEIGWLVLLMGEGVMRVQVTGVGTVARRG
jgi:hypothetical protein